MENSLQSFMRKENRYNRLMNSAIELKQASNYRYSS